MYDTEDETFRKLKQSPFEVVRAELNRNPTKTPMLL